MLTIKIQTNADFTPKGKRVAKIVRHTKSGKKVAAHIRWFVGGKAYRSLQLTHDNAALSKEWLQAA